MKSGIKRSVITWMFIAAPLVSAGPISLIQEVPMPLREAASLKEKVPIPVRYGVASWYSESDPGINLHTANGEIFDDSQKTCASWDFPFGTYLKVTNAANSKSVTCRVNDRGPAKRLERLIDLTKTAFGQIADPRSGLIKVSVIPVGKPPVHPL